MMKYVPYINDEDKAKETVGKHTRHHIIPSSRTHPKHCNKTIDLYETFHNSWHRVFGNAVIQEQLVQLLKINGPMLKKGYIEAIEELSQTDDRYVYKNGVWIHR